MIRLDPTIHLDIRYATANNIVHRPVYRQARAFLQRPAAQALVRVHHTLSEKGYGLLVFDGYRPWSVTKIFWESVRPEQHAFVADPKKGSKHNRGCAVDLSLYDLATGREVEMPSAYDETSERASPDYAGGTGGQRARRDLLRSAMEKDGFAVEPNEWWHFNYRNWRDYPILDVPFEAIPNSSAARPSAATGSASMRAWATSSQASQRPTRARQDSQPGIALSALYSEPRKPLSRRGRPSGEVPDRGLTDHGSPRLDRIMRNLPG